MTVRPQWLLLLLALVTLARAQPEPPAADPVIATVTPETGDTGGKLFGRAPDPAKTRHYYIAAEPVDWRYAPNGRDDICGAPLPLGVMQQPVVAKLRYVQYTDARFATRVPENASLGIMGPVLRGQVGEYLEVTFLNRTNRPLSMHPHGLKYDKDNEGAYYWPSPGLGAAVAPGARFTYVWQLDASSGPLAGEPSSKAWLYHSHVAADAEINLGLFGCIIVTDPKRTRPDGTPADVDREFVATFMIFNDSGLEDDDASASSTDPARSWSAAQQLIELGSRFTINGRIFGNLPPFEMNEGERVRWYLFGLGSEHDLHTAHWHGMRVVEDGRRRTDVVELLPGSMKVADMVADVPGSWMFHCHVAEHMREGMFAAMRVDPPSRATDRLPAHRFLGLPLPAAGAHTPQPPVAGTIMTAPFLPVL